MLKLEIDILSGMIAGENNAYETCYKLFSPAVYTTIFRICRHEATANDLLQDTFIDAFKSIETFNSEGPFLPWIKKIGFNNTLNYIKKVKRQSEFVFDLKNLYAEDTYISDEVENLNLLDVILSKVTETERMILWLSVVEQYSHEDIGQLFEKSASFSKSILSRTLKKLKVQPEVKKHAG